MKIYRLHITCPAKHTTYQDYKTKKYAELNLAKMNDKTTWYATHIEVIQKEGKTGYSESWAIKAWKAGKIKWKRL